MKQLLDQTLKIRDEGQKEYAHTQENVFRNFEDIGKSLNLSREKVLLVYLLKHIDGIIAYAEGHKSQREDISGRIVDAIVYLCLFYGMTQDGSNSPGEVEWVSNQTE